MLAGLAGCAGLVRLARLHCYNAAPPRPPPGQTKHQPTLRAAAILLPNQAKPNQCRQQWSPEQRWRPQSCCTLLPPRSSQHCSASRRTRPAARNTGRAAPGSEGIRAVSGAWWGRGRWGRTVHNSTPENRQTHHNIFIYFPFPKFLNILYDPLFIKI